MEAAMSSKKLFLYAEIRGASSGDCATIVAGAGRHSGLRSGTCLRAIDADAEGGFFEFDSLEAARDCAGALAEAARRLGGELHVRLFDGETTAQASRALRSPFYCQAPAGSSLEVEERSAAIDA